MPERDENAPAQDVAPALMTEYLSDDWAYFLRSSRQFEKFTSPHQAIEVHETTQFGKLFRLDGHFMTSEKDEFFYHENLVHPAALTHPKPARALIVGGGDGGSSTFPRSRIRSRQARSSSGAATADPPKNC
jgi:spermidine synthase